MMNTEPVDIKLQFPTKSYIHQLFFSPFELIIWRPKRFWMFYTMQLLEQSLQLDYIEHTKYRAFLERCLKISLPKEQDIFKNHSDNHDANS